VPCDGSCLFEEIKRKTAKGEEEEIAIERRGGPDLFEWGCFLIFFSNYKNNLVIIYQFFSD